jgi:hypothetical protein
LLIIPYFHSRSTKAFKLPSEMVEEMPDLRESQGDEDYTNVNLQQPVDRDNVDPNRIRVKPAKIRLDLETNKNNKKSVSLN